jgi:hypothetical protein
MSKFRVLRLQSNVKSYLRTQEIRALDLKHLEILMNWKVTILFTSMKRLIIKI